MKRSILPRHRRFSLGVLGWTALCFVGVMVAVAVSVVGERSARQTARSDRTESCEQARRPGAEEDSDDRRDDQSAEAENARGEDSPIEKALGPFSVSVTRDSEPREGTGRLTIVLLDHAETALSGVRLKVFTPPGERPKGQRYQAGPVAVGPEGLTLENVPPGRKLVRARWHDLARTVSVKIYSGKTTSVVIRFPPTGVVEGIVRHQRDGPVRDTLILFGRSLGAACRDVFQARTTADGFYRMTGIPRGLYEVSCGRWRTRVAVPGVDIVRRDLTFGVPVLTGRVLIKDSGRPVPDVKVLAFGEVSKSTTNVVTDREGRFEFQDLLPGPYLLSVKHPRYAQTWDKANLPKAVAPGTVTLFMVLAGDLKITLLDDKMAPVPGVFHVYWTRRGGGGGGGRRLVANAQGQAILRGLAPGVCDILVRCEGFGDRRLVHTVGTAECDLRIVLRRVSDLPDVVIAGVVLNSAKGTPIPDVEVRCPETGELTVTDTKGRFAFRGARESRKSLSFAKAMWVFRRTAIRDLDPAKLQQIEVILQKACRLQLDVRNSDGSPARGEAQLRFRFLGGKEKGTWQGGLVTLDDSGRANYDLLAPGNYLVLVIPVEAAGSGSGRVTLSLTGGSLKVVLK